MEGSKRTLHFKQFGPLRIDIRTLSLEHLTQALTLQTGLCDSEVNKSYSGAECRCEFDGRVACGEVDLEVRRDVDVLVSDRYQHATTAFAQLAIQHWIQQRIVVLRILHQQRISCRVQPFVTILC